MSVRPHALLTSLAWLACTTLAQASDWSVCPGLGEPSSKDAPQRYELFLSPYTYHWTHSPEHKAVGAASLSWILPEDRFCGLSLFRNSFGQPSAYAYTGWSFPRPLESMPNVYMTVTAGVIYGYVGKYKNKVPLNAGGFAPAIIPAVGYRLTPTVSLEMQVLGTAALMFGTSVRF